MLSYPTPPSPISATREPGAAHLCTRLVKASLWMKSGSRRKGTVDEGLGFATARNFVTFEVECNVF
jgi:hypothetical protein